MTWYTGDPVYDTVLTAGLILAVLIAVVSMLASLAACSRRSRLPSTQLGEAWWSMMVVQPASADSIRASRPE